MGGLVIGLGTVAVGAAGVSLIASPPPRPEVASDTPKPSQTEPGDLRPVDPAGADPDLVKSTPSSLVGENVSEDSAVPGLDTDSAARPQVGMQSGELTDPSGAADAPEMAGSVEETAQGTAMPGTSGPVPQEPTRDSEARISPDPAQPPVPTLTQPEVETGTRPALAGEATGDTTDARESVINAQSSQSSQSEPSDPALSGDTTADSTTSDTADAQPEAQTAPPSQPDPQQEAERTPLPQIAAQPVPETTTDTAETPTPQPDGETASETTTETAQLSPTIGTPATALTDSQRTTAAVPTRPVIPAISAHAEPFENGDDRPLMSIVLLDQSNSVSPGALADFPYPITFALDPSDPDAPQKMESHRANGHEVVLIADLPTSASPQDAEAAMQVWQDALPKTVAILEGTKTGFQTNRPAADQMTEIALASGHGLITQSNGLNTVQKLASKAGVPASVVFRDFDGTGQTPTVMRRFLDQAAFRARQEGGVIMLGRLQPDTISALILWGLQDRAQRVALAPVSAVLINKPQAE